MNEARRQFSLTVAISLYCLLVFLSLCPCLIQPLIYILFDFGVHQVVFTLQARSVRVSPTMYPSQDRRLLTPPFIEIHLQCQYFHSIFICSARVFSVFISNYSFSPVFPPSVPVFPQDFLNQLPLVPVFISPDPSLSLSVSSCSARLLCPRDDRPVSISLCLQLQCSSPVPQR